MAAITTPAPQPDHAVAAQLNADWAHLLAPHHLDVGIAQLPPPAGSTTPVRRYAVYRHRRRRLFTAATPDELRSKLDAKLAAWAKVAGRTYTAEQLLAGDL